MVVSQHYLATDAGQSILAAGGNAYDASIAVAFALAVVLPRAGNIGGGGFVVMFDAASNQTYSIDYREIAPELATKDMFLADDGTVDKKRATQGILSIGVPGTVYGMWEVHQKFGSLPWDQLLAPAIKLAEDGFLVSPFMADALNERYDKLSGYKNFKRIFYSDHPVQMHQRLKQESLAKTLKTISSKGVKGFYEGSVAEKIDNYMKKNGGLITKNDLKIQFDEDQKVNEKALIENFYKDKINDNEKIDLNKSDNELNKNEIRYENSNTDDNNSITDDNSNTDNNLSTDDNSNTDDNSKWFLIIYWFS